MPMPQYHSHSDEIPEMTQGRMDLTRTPRTGVHGRSWSPPGDHAWMSHRIGPP